MVEVLLLISEKIFLIIKKKKLKDLFSEFFFQKIKNGITEILRWVELLKKNTGMTKIITDVTGKVTEMLDDKIIIERTEIITREKTRTEMAETMAGTVEIIIEWKRIFSRFKNRVPYIT